MTITQVKQALGSWELRLREDTPRELLDQLDPFGHVVVLPGRLPPAQYADNLLRAARYVGVYRGRDSRDEYTLTGAGMAYWLGDEDEKGDIFAAPVTIAAQTYPNAITALLPAGGAVVAGSIQGPAGTYTGRHQYVTPRTAITYVTDLAGIEWRVNGDGTLDTGTVAQLYRTTPTATLVRKGLQGRELSRVAIGGQLQLSTDVEDYSNRVIVLAEGESGSIAKGEATYLGVIPYRDIHGNPPRITRLVSSAETNAGNANAVAQLQLNRFTNPRQAVSLTASAYDITGDLVVGDTLAVFDPANGYVDTANEAYWRGQPINPVHLRCIELTWPVPAGWTVAFRRGDGTWLDLSNYYAPESGNTTIKVGELGRALTGIGGQPVGTRPNVDTSTPAAPTFTGFSPGTYQSDNTSTTKAAIWAQWSIPLNQDGSAVQDGDHYELRYRPNLTLQFAPTWGELATSTWGALNTWGAPIGAPVVANPQWTVVYIGWGTNAFTITELTPGVTYELQIRAVDSATPPNRGPYSASSNVTTIGDQVAPSVPAVPLIAASRIAIQVVHQCGKASGGTFNLEQDLDHLDVHVGGAPSFFPDASNKAGELIANAGTMAAAAASVGTFAIEQTDQVHVKVVAVDRSGNRSGASQAATATADLIDDAHISDLTVSKITAGTITATWINAGRIATALEGARLELEGTGFNGYNAAGDRTFRMNADTARLEVYQQGFLYPPVELGLTSDGTYGMRLQDLFAETKLLVGQIDPNGDPSDSENYGLAVRNAIGQIVKLSTLAFGLDAQSVSALESTSSSTFGDLTTFGPQVNVVIGNSGRALVFISAEIQVTVARGNTINTSGGYMGFQLYDSDGNSVLASVVSRAACFELRYDKTGPVEDTQYDGRNTATRVVLLSGLAAGAYSLVARYRATIGPVSFSDRTLIALPY